jgi:hypothetical protein
MPNRLLTRDEVDALLAAWVVAWNARAAYLRATQEVNVGEGEAEEQDRQDRGQEHA